ncbi:MAG: glycoside hydrolase family 3 C-terminal domain-containing protein, partial [bacterium]
PPRGVSPLEGIRNAVNPGTEVVFVRGCNIEIGKVYFNAIPSKYLRTPDGKEGLKGEYFNNPNLQGSPALVRVDRSVDFDWGLGAPASNLPSDNFSVRWTGKLIAPETRTYEIYARTDDGVRLWIDGKLLIDSWHDRAASNDIARINLVAGKEYDIKIEYYEHQGFAVAQLGWDYGKRELPPGIFEAAEAAKNADVAVVFVGIVEGEGQDRAHIDLPGFQEELINEVVKTGTPTVVVIIAGSAVTGDWIDRVPAILMAWYPGQEGGTAIAETLFGENNPGGKLPFTWPRYVGQLPLYYNYKPTGRGYDYVDMPGRPLFPFGHGLSYTKFEYKNLSISADGEKGNVEISFEVTNSGDREGEEVAQLYLHDVVASVARPVMELKRFKRVRLAPGESTTIKFQLTPDDLAFFNINMKKVVEPGDFEVMVGSSSGDIRLRGSFRVNRLITTSFDCALLTPQKVKAKAGEINRMSLLVRNKGTISDLCPVQLYLDGKLIESHKVDLAPGERRAVDFWVEMPKAGKHELMVGIPNQLRKVVLEVAQ